MKCEGYDVRNKAMDFSKNGFPYTLNPEPYACYKF